MDRLSPTRNKGFISLFSALEFHSLQAVTAGLALSGRPVMCNGANLSFKRSAIKNYLESVRNDISSGDDMFLLHSIKKAGGKIVCLNDQESKVYTRLPHRFIDLLRQRSRWAGKSIYYRDADTIITGLATALANLSIVIISILSIFFPGMWKILILLFAVKAIPDILLLSGHLRMKKKISLLSWFIPVSVLYPFYTVLIFLVSLFRRSDW